MEISRSVNTLTLPLLENTGSILKFQLTTYVFELQSLTHIFALPSSTNFSFFFQYPQSSQI